MSHRQLFLRPEARPVRLSEARSALEVRAVEKRVATSLLGGEIVLLSAALLLLAAGAVAIALWWADASTLKARIDAAAPDGSAISFPLARMQLLQTRVGVYGCGMCLVALLAIATRKRLLGPLRQLVGETAAVVSGGYADLRAWSRAERGHLLALSLIVVAAFVVRLAFLHQDMRYDEADSYLMFARRSLLYGLSEYPEPGNHLLNTLLVHASVSLFGDAPWAVRLPAFVCGILIIPAGYWALRGWFGRSSALVTAGLLAGSSYLVHYSVNARGYGFVVLAFCLELALCSRLSAKPNRGVAVLLGVVSAVGFYAVPTMLFPFGACIALLAVIALRQRHEGDWQSRVRDIVIVGAVTAILTLVFYGPVFVVAGPGAVAQNKYVSATSWAQLLELLGDRLGLFAAEMARTPGIAVLLAIGVLVWFARDLKRGARTIVLTAVFFAWCGLVVVFLKTAPYGRVWTFAMPLLYGLGAAGVVVIAERITRHSRATLAVLVLALTSWMCVDTLRTRSPSFSQAGERVESAQDVAVFLKGTLTAHDRVLAVNPVRPSLWYYTQRVGLPADVMSHDAGGHPFSHAVVSGPLDQFNEVLLEWNLPALGEERLIPMRSFPGVTVYRIEPPLPY